MKHLLEHWTEVEKTLGSNLLLLSDYDGTLTPIVERPQDAVLSEGMRKILTRVSKHYPIGIISGRALVDVKKMVGIDGIYYSGNHGFEISGPDVELTKKEAERARPTISEICTAIKVKSAQFEGMIVEDKGSTASVHYRMVAEDKVQELKELFNELVDSSVRDGKIRVTRGKKVLEIRPDVDWDKGRAAEWLIDVVSKERGKIYPVYMGDDATDEDAFLVLKGKGLAVLVTQEERESNAEYYLRNTEEVGEFLRRLIPTISRSKIIK